MNDLRELPAILDQGAIILCREMWQHNDEKQMMINDLVRSYGLEISPSKKPGTICAVWALEYIYDKYGYLILDATLRLTLATWESETNSLSANF